MSNSGIPSVDENNPLYCPELPKSTFLKAANRRLALRRGRQKVTDQRRLPLNHLSSDFIRKSTTGLERILEDGRILEELLAGNVSFLGPNGIDTGDDDDDLPPYSYTDASWSPTLRRGPKSGNALYAASIYAPIPNHGARKLKRGRKLTFSDFVAPKYARSVLSAHDSSFDVDVCRETLEFFGPPTSPEEKAATATTRLGSTTVRLPTNGIDNLVHQLSLALPGIRLEERLRAFDSLTPQMIMDFLVDNGHLNMRTLDILRLSDVEKIVFPRSFFNRENGLNLRGTEIYSVFGKQDAFRTLTRLSFLGTRLIDSDIVHIHHLPRLSVLVLDETGIANEAVFLLVPLKATLSKLSLSMNPDINNEAVPAILILYKLSFLSIQDTAIDMAGLRKMAEVVHQEKRVIRLRLPYSCENYIQNVHFKYFSEPKPPLVTQEQHCNQLSVRALKWNLEAHAACNPDILTTGTRLEMIHRLAEILRIRRLDKLVIDLVWKIGLRNA